LGISKEKLDKWESGSYDFSVREISYICEKLELSYEIRFEEVRKVSDWNV